MNQIESGTPVVVKRLDTANVDDARQFLRAGLTFSTPM